MTGSRCWSLLALTLVLVSLPAVAWNAAGHRLVASIAWDFLAPEARAKATGLLRAHPDYERWLKRAGDDNPDRLVFIESSTWPDEIRKDPRFYNEGLDDPTPALPGFPDMERHRNWHYVNRPLDGALRQALLSGLLEKQLVVLTETLGSSGASASERGYALPWLIHLTGDAHQPLHASVRLDAEGRSDKSSNEVINPFNPRKRVSTLHAFWDDLPGPPWLRGERLDASRRALIAIHPRPEPSASSGQWIDESWQIARTSAYPPSKESTLTISEDFYESRRETAERRITEAGYRLAELLNRLFK